MTPYQKVRVLLVLVSAQFDYTPGITGYMNVDVWKGYVFVHVATLTSLDVSLI